MTFRRFLTRTRSKMGNVRSRCAYAHNHASKLECSLCEHLHGLYEKVETEITLRLGPTRLGYRADFRVTDKDGNTRYVEAKSDHLSRGDKWRSVRANWKLYGPAPLDVYKGTAARLVLSETINPEGIYCPKCGEKL